MKLSVLFIGLLGNALGQDSVCPNSWGEGKNKCFKFIGKRMKLMEAGKACKALGGRIFTPSDETEIAQIREVARRKPFGMRWPAHSVWIGLKVANTDSKVFPPDVVGMRGDAPAQWLKNTKLTTPIWDAKVKQMIRTSKNVRLQMKNIKMQKGVFSLTKPGVKSFGAAGLCEMDKPQVVVGDPNHCWQPKSDIFDELSYTGDVSMSEWGVECAAWDDESMHEHAWKDVGSHNFCRNPNNEATGPWCYVNDEDEKWNYCSIPKCKQPVNEFIRDQAACGKRPEIDRDLIRVINGRDAALGEAPYQVRLRYYKKMNLGLKMSDHQCGATLISSCWAITAAHCIFNDFWFTSKGGAEYWFRVDVGNRYYQKDLDDIKPDREADFSNHQTLRVKQVIVHPRYITAATGNDVALLQLYPSSEDGTCAVFGDTVQPACINQDHTRFPDDTKCMISGWGDVNAEENGVQQPDMLQVAFVKIFNFEQCAADFKGSAYLKTRNHLCAKGDGTDSCQGDSGGPLVCFLGEETGNAETESRAFAGKSAYLAGVVSFGAGCNNPKYAGVYVPTSHYYQWIKKEVDKAGPVDYDPIFACRDAQCRT